MEVDQTGDSTAPVNNGDLQTPANIVGGANLDGNAVSSDLHGGPSIEDVITNTVRNFIPKEPQATFNDGHVLLRTKRTHDDGTEDPAHQAAVFLLRSGSRNSAHLKREEEGVFFVYRAQPALVHGAEDVGVGDIGNGWGSNRFVPLRVVREPWRQRFLQGQVTEARLRQRQNEGGGLDGSLTELREVDFDADWIRQEAVFRDAQAAAWWVVNNNHIADDDNEVNCYLVGGSGGGVRGLVGAEVEAEADFGVGDKWEDLQKWMENALRTLSMRVG